MESYHTGSSCPGPLPDFPYTPHFAHVQWDAYRGSQPVQMAYIDEAPSTSAPKSGERAVIVLLHGEPTWSYLYRSVTPTTPSHPAPAHHAGSSPCCRFMIPPLLRAGHRVIAPDLIGFGRSEKPLDPADMSYLKQVGWVRDLLLNHLRLGQTRQTAMTLFVQDWGSLIGLRLVAEFPWAFARVVVGNGFLPTGSIKGPSAAFRRWLAFSQSTPELPVGGIVAAGVKRDLDAHEIAAYDAPFPEEALKATARALPALVPTAPTSAAALDNAAAWSTLARYQRPFVTAFSDGDPITRGADVVLRARIAGCRGQAHTTVPGGHFLQEDAPQQLVQVILRAIADNPTAGSLPPLVRCGALPVEAKL